MKKQKKNEALIWGARQFLRNCTTAATNAQRYWRGRVTRRANYAITMSLIHRRGVRELKARVIQFAWMRQKIVKRKLWKTRNETTNNNQNGINHIYTCVGLNLQPMQSTVTTKKSSPTKQKIVVDKHSRMHLKLLHSIFDDMIVQYSIKV